MTNPPADTPVNTPVKILIPIDDICASCRVTNSLRQAGIYNFAELQHLTVHELLKIRGIGRKCVKEVREILKDFGLSLKGEETLSHYSHTLLNKLPLLLLDLHKDLSIFESRISEIQSYLLNIKKETNDPNPT